MESFGKLIYTPETAAGEAIGKVESHTPKIDAPETAQADQSIEVKISVGPHPSTIEHSIRKIEVYFYENGRPFNPLLLGVIDFTPVYSEPIVKITIKPKKSGTIFALGYCNLHGIWEGKKELKVE